MMENFSRARRRYSAWILTGLMVLAAGMATPFLWTSTDPWIPILLLLFGTACSLTGLTGLIMKPPAEPVIDERIRSVRDRALSGAWAFALLAVVTLYFLNRTGILFLSADAALTLTFFALILGGGVLQWLHFRKGDAP